MFDYRQERLRPCRAEDPFFIRGEASASVRAGGGAPAPLKKCWLLLLIVLVLGVSYVSAHELSRSESKLSITGATVHVQFAINLLEFRGVDANGDDRVSYDELDARIEDVFGAIKQHYVLATPAPPARVVMQRQQIVEEHVLQADLVYTFDRPVRELRVESTLEAVTTPGHVHHVRTDISGETLQALLTPQSRTATFLVGGITIGRIAIVLVAVAAVAAVITLRIVGRRSRRSTRAA